MSSASSWEDSLSDSDLAYPLMRHFNSRLHTFPATWPPPTFRLTRSALASEGFFFSPSPPSSLSSSSSPSSIPSDRTLCYACGTQLINWKSDDDATVEHRKHTAGQCPLIMIRDRRDGSRKEGGTGSGGGRRRGRTRRSKRKGKVEGDDDDEAMEAKEERDALIAIVYHSAPTLLDALRSKQRKRRREEVTRELQGNRAKLPHTLRRDHALHSLFMQQMLMTVLNK